MLCLSLALCVSIVSVWSYSRFRAEWFYVCHFIHRANAIFMLSTWFSSVCNPIFGNSISMHTRGSTERFNPIRSVYFEHILCVFCVFHSYMDDSYASNFFFLCLICKHRFLIQCYTSQRYFNVSFSSQPFVMSTF